MRKLQELEPYYYKELIPSATPLGGLGLPFGRQNLH